METSILIEVMAYILIVIILTPFVAYMLAKENLFFTFLDTGNIKYIYKGETLKKVIADVDKFKISGYELILDKGKQEKTWLQNKFGLFWIGIPPFSKIKTFKVRKKREVEETKGKSPSEWIQDLGEVEVDSLRFSFPRPFLIQEAELKEDRQTVDLLLICKFITVDAYIPIPELKGDFFELAGSIIRGSVLDKVKDQGPMENFLIIDKGEKGFLEILTEKDSGLNIALKKQTGLRLVGISVADWNPTNQATREAMNKKFIAEKIREAELIDADTYQQKIAIHAEADAKAAERIAQSRAVRIKKTLESISLQGGNPDEIVKAAARILQAESLTNLTTLVESGSNTPAVIPIKN